MKRIPKVPTSGMSAKAVVRRLSAAARLPRAKRVLSFVLAALAVLFPVALLIGLLAGLEGGGSFALLSVCAALFCAALLSLLSVAFFSARYASLRTVLGRNSLFEEYIRGRLFAALAAYKHRLLERVEGEALLRDAREYAARFVLSVEECEALASSEDLEEAGLGILVPYHNLLAYLAGAEDGACRRYLSMRARMRAEIARRCRYILPRHAAVHYPLLARNMHLVERTVADNFSAFLEADIVLALRPLLAEAVFYRDPEQAGRRLMIPKRSRYRAFLSLIDGINSFPVHGIAVDAGGRHLEEYRALLDEYDAYAAGYTLYGSDTVDSKRCREWCDEAVKDANTCYSCGLDYNGRHRAVCPRCGHYICPDCGACYCERVISHDMTRATFHHQ